MPDLVYIADDEPNIRKLAALALKDSGFETQEFADGVSLMAAVRVRKPDAIVLDWMMPPPDGLAVCHKIRADESTRPIPILMLTARGEDVGRILRTFKIKKNVEVTDNGKIII
ncbi:response regulator receiver domain protein [[Clostridium] leptum DSM 753]|uniref:Stage 0 sporulation protein A homolog n=1 Tax=[Clostridium] leptum DSM 753 TaxID=428125 RepID=A7VZ23_9FIRM|nr:response regulator receiver domain protein [[Clostridium] leptum DSM 753]MCC3320849.1 response regulator [[Clostridium] innocuum]PEQ25319.1 response regulator [[Clostridium] leptum DSM 753]